MSLRGLLASRFHFLVSALGSASGSRSRPWSYETARAKIVFPAESNELEIFIPEQVLFRDLGGESVLLHLTSGEYFGLDEIGTLIWQLLSEGRTLEEVEVRLLDDYDGSQEQIRGDLNRIVQELASAGLLQVRGAR